MTNFGKMCQLIKYELVWITWDDVNKFLFFSQPHRPWRQMYRHGLFI